MLALATYPVEVVLLAQQFPHVAAMQLFKERGGQRGREGRGDGHAVGDVHQSLDAERHHRPLALAVEALEPVQRIVRSHFLIEIII